MAGEWIAGKARGLLGMFPGQWEEVQPEIWQGRCPGEHLHHGHNAATDCRIHTCYGAGGQPPGIYCLHSSCKGVLEALNHDFREALFAKDPDWKPGPRPNDGVVERAPRAKEAWIPDYDEAVLEKTVRAVPEVDAEWFMRRSPVDPRGVGPGEFLEHVFQPGELALVFTNFKSQGDFLWQAGTGGWRLSDRRGVRAVRSKLPVDGGKDGVWFLSNPADGKWHPNPRRQGAYSRRSMESITAWRHLVLESDVAPEGLWLRLLAMCPVPVVAIYSSGGRSWHALCRVDMASKADFDSRMRTDVKLNAPLLGADPGAMTPVRLTRLPGCTRGGRMQRLIFLHPRARELQPILNLPELRTIEHGKGNE
jgi:hypothetical protein